LSGLLSSLHPPFLFPKPTSSRYSGILQRLVHNKFQELWEQEISKNGKDPAESVNSENSGNLKFPRFPVEKNFTCFIPPWAEAGVKRKEEAEAKVGGEEGKVEGEGGEEGGKVEGEATVGVEGERKEEGEAKAGSTTPEGEGGEHGGVKGEVEGEAAPAASTLETKEAEKRREKERRGREDPSKMEDLLAFLERETQEAEEEDEEGEEGGRKTTQKSPKVQTSRQKEYARIRKQIFRDFLAPQEKYPVHVLPSNFSESELKEFNSFYAELKNPENSGVLENLLEISRNHPERFNLDAETDVSLKAFLRYPSSPPSPLPPHSSPSFLSFLSSSPFLLTLLLPSFPSSPCLSLNFRFYSTQYSEEWAGLKILSFLSFLSFPSSPSSPSSPLPPLSLPLLPPYTNEHQILFHPILRRMGRPKNGKPRVASLPKISVTQKNQRDFRIRQKF
jgi:hypothetical protein